MITLGIVVGVVLIVAVIFYRSLDLDVSVDISDEEIEDWCKK